MWQRLRRHTFTRSASGSFLCSGLMSSETPEVQPTSPQGIVGGPFAVVSPVAAEPARAAANTAARISRRPGRLASLIRAGPESLIASSAGQALGPRDPLDQRRPLTAQFRPPLVLAAITGLADPRLQPPLLEQHEVVLHRFR